MPSSRAISAIGRPLLRTSSTASRLNSAVNWRRFLGCLSSMRTSSAQGRCPASGGKSKPAGVAVAGALLVVAVHLTDGGVHVHGQRPVVGAGARRPCPGEDLAGHLIELTDVAEREAAQ